MVVFFKIPVDNPAKEVPFIFTTVDVLPTEVTSPVKLALVAFAVLTAEVTNSVVANLVLLSVAVWVIPVVPVGNVGVPVNVGEARGAFSANASNTAF